MNAHYLNQKICLRRYLRRLPFLLIASMLSLSLAQATPILAAPYIPSPDNGQFVWARDLGGTDWDEAFDTFVDGAGNSYTVGIFDGTADFDPGPRTFNLTSAGGSDIFVTKLDSAGNFVWAKAFRGVSLYAAGYSIFVDGAGGVYTTGRFEGGVDFDPGPGSFTLVCPGADDIFVSKLDSQGNFVWARSFGGQLYDEGRGIFVDGKGGVYTTGQFGGTADFDPGAGVFNLTSAGSSDIFVSKLDNAGKFVWARAMGGLSDDWAKGIFVDTAGTVYTTGEFADTADFDPGPGVFNLISGGFDEDIFVSKLDSAGDFVWANAMGGDGADIADSIFVGAAGDVYTTGFFQNTADFDPGAGVYNLYSSGDFEAFISKLDEAGDFVWAKGLDGNSEGSSIFVDGAEDVYTTGDFAGTVDFDPGPGTFNLTSAGGSDGYVSKLDSAGEFIWARAFGGQDYERSYSLFVDGAGNVYTTGGFFGTADFNPGASAFNLTSAGESDVFVSKLGVVAKIVVTNHAIRSGGEVAITLTLENQGPADGSGAQLSIPAPTNASGFSWTCSASGGAACPASGGSGVILHTLDAFPFGGEITYLATAPVTNPSQPVASHGTLTAPPGVNFTGTPAFHFGEFWRMILPWILFNVLP